MFSVHNNDYLEMGKTYKVHLSFDVDEMTTEDPCTCSGPESGKSIFNFFHNSTKKELQIFNSYNTTMNGSILSEEDVDWSQLKKSECEALLLI